MFLIKYIGELAVLFLEFTSFFFVSCSIFEVKAMSKVKEYLTCLLGLPFFCLLAITNAQLPILLLVLNIFYFVGLWFIFKEHLFDLFLIFVADYMLITFAQLTFVPIIKLFLLHINSYRVQITGSSLSLVILFIIYKYADLSFIYRFIKNASILMKTIVGNSFILTFSVTYYFKISSDKFFQYFILLFVILLLILFVNGNLILTNNQMTKQKKQIETYQEYLPIVEQLIDHVRQTQHAHNNNIQAIRMLPTAYDNYDDLSNELMHYTNYLVVENEPIALLKINLKLLSGFLYSKILYAQSVNKRLRIEILDFIYKQEAPEYDLITMIGILVDNALEASQDNDSVYAQLKSENHKLVFVIKNIGPSITPEFISMIFQKGYTSKLVDNKNHGIGLFHLKSMTQRYHGSITVFNEIIHDRNYLCFELKV